LEWKMWGGESVWRSNWIVQQASKVLRTMQSMASMIVLTLLSAGSVIQPSIETLDWSTHPVWTGQPQYRIIPISRCPTNAPVRTRFPP
jgi:hypothetical protein